MPLDPKHTHPKEWALGNKRTAALGSYVGKLVTRSLRLQAFQALSGCFGFAVWGVWGLGVLGFRV